MIERIKFGEGNLDGAEGVMKLSYYGAVFCSLVFVFDKLLFKRWKI